MRITTGKYWWGASARLIKWPISRSIFVSMTLVVFLLYWYIFTILGISRLSPPIWTIMTIPENIFTASDKSLREKRLHFTNSIDSNNQNFIFHCFETCLWNHCILVFGIVPYVLNALVPRCVFFFFYSVAYWFFAFLVRLQGDDFFIFFFIETARKYTHNLALSIIHQAKGFPRYFLFICITLIVSFTKWFLFRGSLFITY